MPTNLQALIRYRTIDNCLRRKGRKWSWKELAKACADATHYYTGIDKEPSRRTMMYDIDNMKNGRLGYYAPIEYNRAEKTYFYTDPDFSISNTPINQEDIGELNHALSILKQFSGFKHMEGIENIITKLEYTLSLRGERAKEVIQFDHQLNAPGQKWLNQLYQTIQKEKCIELKYQPFNLDYPFDTIVSPYLLKEYNKRWFLFGYDHNKKRIQNYGLDRIKEIGESIESYYVDAQFNTSTYFDNIIGVSNPPKGTLQNIVLEVLPEQAKYIKTKALHHSQEIIEEMEKFTIFSYKLIPNYELTSLILSFGEKVKVLEPAELKAQVAKRIIDAGENY